MSMVKFLRIWLHNVFGSHEFKLVRRKHGCMARCSCGAMIARAK